MEGFVGLFFVFVIGMIAYGMISSYNTHLENQNSPVQNTPVKVVGKRSEVSGGGGNFSTTTSYYLTFEFESGDRIELGVKGKDFGMIAEGDIGVLNFQGTQFNSFTRNTQGATEV